MPHELMRRIGAALAVAAQVAVLFVLHPCACVARDVGTAAEARATCCCGPDAPNPCTSPERATESPDHCTSPSVQAACRGHAPPDAEREPVSSLDAFVVVRADALDVVALVPLIADEPRGGPPPADALSLRLTATTVLLS